MYHLHPFPCSLIALVVLSRSDVLGHILPMVGHSWAQLGVAKLFTKIQDNGYKFLYLSARAIGQARITREYLRRLRQGEICLPDGPLLLSPTSLISALHRYELIFMCNFNFSYL